MEQQSSHKEHGPECPCPMCSYYSGCRRMHGCYGGGYGYRVARWILGILLIIFVFSCGMWFGRMTSVLRSYGYNGYGSGYYMMNSRYGGNYAPMMYGYDHDGQSGTPSAPAQQ